MNKCVRAKVYISGGQAVIETEDGKKAVVPQRTLHELIKRYNLCIENNK
jgi:hypothetical protein